MIGSAVFFGLLCVFGGLQGRVLAQDGGKLSYPSALERIESLVGSLNESLQEARLCLNETKKKLGKVQREKEALEAQLLETRNELAVTKYLHQQAIDELRATQDNSRSVLEESLEEVKRQGADFEIRLKRVKRKVSVLEDEELPRQLNELNEVTRDLRRLEDENLPRRVNELANDFHKIVNKVSTAEFRHNSTTYKLKDELRQLKSEAQKLENKLKAALSTLPDEQLVDRVQELTDKYNSLQLKLFEVEVGEEEWESRIGMSRALMEVSRNLSDVEGLFSNMSATLEQGLIVTRANFSKVKGEVEVVEKELCEKVHNLTTQVEDVQQRSTQRVSDLSQKVHATSTVASQQQESIDSLRRDLRQQSNTVTRLGDRSRVTQHDTTTDRLKQRVAEQESNVSRLSSNIQVQVHSTENLTSTVTEQGICIAQLKRDVEEIGIDARNVSELSNVKQLQKCYQPKAITSCKELYQCNPATPTGHYNIRTPQGVKRVYCEMNTNNCGDVRGGWMQVAHIKMTDPRHTCPQGLGYIVQSSKRMCAYSGRAAGCSSVTFPQYGVPYTKVCGRARGYQYGLTQAFTGYHVLSQSLEGYYVQGLSVTHGTLRRHIWTFAAGVSKNKYTYTHNCPCARYHQRAAPSYIGENYYCESGYNYSRGGLSHFHWHLDDPLWDSQGCHNESTCCDCGGPWFTATLSQEVSDDIEVRWCYSGGDPYKDYGVDQLEIFVN